MWWVCASLRNNVVVHNLGGMFLSLIQARLHGERKTRNHYATSFVKRHKNARSGLLDLYQNAFFFSNVLQPGIAKPLTFLRIQSQWLSLNNQVPHVSFSIASNFFLGLSGNGRGAPCFRNWAFRCQLSFFICEKTSSAIGTKSTQRLGEIIHRVKWRFVLVRSNI